MANAARQRGAASMLWRLLSGSRRLKRHRKRSGKRKQKKTYQQNVSAATPGWRKLSGVAMENSRRLKNHRQYENVGGVSVIGVMAKKIVINEEEEAKWQSAGININQRVSLAWLASAEAVSREKQRCGMHNMAALK
jgi:hypothetical protein